MVRDALKVRERMQELRHLAALLRIQLLSVQLQQIGAKFVFVHVDQGFQIHYPLIVFFLKFPQQADGQADGILRMFGHFTDGSFAVLQCQRRVRQEALFQLQLLLLFLFVLFGNQFCDNGLDHVRQRRQHQQVCQAEQRVQQGGRKRIHHQAEERKTENRIGNIEDGSAAQHPQNRSHQINQSSPFSAGSRPDRREQHRDRCTDVNAHQQGQNRFKSQCPRNGKSLKNAHRRRRRLQHRGEQGSDQDAQQRILHGGHHPGKPGLLPQTADRAAHGMHAQHQDREAQQNITDVLLLHTLAVLVQDNPGDRHGSRQGACGKNTAEAAGTLNITEAQHPASNTGTEDGPENDVDRLPDGHHAGVYKTYRHN